ncbi:MAG: DUF5106 domain-containing protein [Bacteroides sp.]
MIILFKCLSLALVFCLFACKSGNASSQANNTTPQDTVQPFTLPIIPPMLTTPEQRAHFLVKHYWDAINLTDTNYIHHPEITEQAWTDYCDLLNHVPLETAQAALKSLLLKNETNKKMYHYLTELADKYLYDPNSPMRNEEFYIPVLQTMTASPALNKTEKIRPQERLKLALRNRKGTKALDFNYTLASGAEGSLYGIQADYTLLLINNPGCHACAEAIASIQHSAVLGQLIASKRLKVLAFYPDKELDEWKKHLSEFPNEWINGYDKEFKVSADNRYDLRAIPTLYLLDKKKTVLLKDAPAEAIEEYLK